MKTVFKTFVFALLMSLSFASYSLTKIEKTQTTDLAISTPTDPPPPIPINKCIA